MVKPDQPPTAVPQQDIAQLSAHSRLAQRLRRRYADEGHLLGVGVPVRDAQSQLLQTLLQRDPQEPAAALRITRQLVLERVLTLDCAHALPLAEVTQAMTDLAEITLDAAFQRAEAELQFHHGKPLNQDGTPAALCILGMGKLGARELNVSSDIDLIYVFDSDGHSTGVAQPGGQARGVISTQEYFGKLVRAMQTLIGSVTEHGFVFRVDLALRPNGNSGPNAISLGALEDYFQSQGREWERLAWLKARVVAPQSAIGSPCARALRALVTPFVFRRYLDYSVFDALRVLHRQIREHAAHRSAGNPQRANDVKLSRGGIREIEFIVQLLQVVRGGQFPELRTRPTLSALQRLATARLLPSDTALELAQAYVFLRQVEHRIQYLDDQQTHVLPTDGADLDWIARTMGLADSAALQAALQLHRDRVAQEFDGLLGGGPSHASQAGASPPAVGGLEQVLRLLDAPEHAELQARLAMWREHPRVRGLRDDARERLWRLLQRTVEWLREGEASVAGCVALLDWMESILRRESYLALLLERPRVHARLLRLLGAARWPARYLLKHPGVIDELATASMLDERFDSAAFTRELDGRYAHLRASGHDDDESLLNLLRRAHHAEVFRTLARDLEGRISVEQVADDLSALAQAVLVLALNWCWARLKNAHQTRPDIAVIAYGKLGGKELGYGSDLDLVFVYEDAHDNAGEIYAALVRKVINWLTVKTSEGDLYEIDTALRPNGNAGLLVSRFAAYADYQQQRGSNTAWTWEHQAMTRARCVIGSAALQARFDGVRTAVISSPRDQAALREEISGMRERVRASHPAKSQIFDVKHSPGGMVDIEFSVQFLVLAHSHVHPALRANSGNIALLHAAQDAGLLPGDTGARAALAYRALRQVQHSTRLNEDATHWDWQASSEARAAGLALWTAVFGISG